MKMEVIFLPKSGVRLYETLMASETSRDVLRFYRPVNRGYGVSVRVSALGNGLSLVSELRWYIRRYMTGVLFEIGGMTYCSLILAREIYYDRSVSTDGPWPWRIFYRIRENTIIGKRSPQPGEKRDDFQANLQPGDTVLEVWVSEEELVSPGYSIEENEKKDW